MESPESDERYTPASLQLELDRGNGSIQRTPRSSFRDIGLNRNLVNQFGFIHTSPLVIKINKQETSTANADAIFRQRKSANNLLVI